MLKMTWLKFRPAQAQTKIQKSLCFLCVFYIYAHLLALAALHMASALRAPLAKKNKKQLVLLLFGDFHNSVLKLQEKTGKNDENEPAQVGATKAHTKIQKTL